MLTEEDPSIQMITPSAFKWDVWNATTGPHPAPPASDTTLEDRVRWLLQLDNTSEATVFSAGSSYSEQQAPGFLYPTVMMDRIPTSSSVQYQTFSFGDYITAIAYWNNATVATKGNVRSNNDLKPAVVWLHPYSYATGFTPSYGCDTVHTKLAEAGYVSIAFDQVGFGMRILEGGNTFYARHGRRASLFGHMVRDARAAVDVLSCLGDAESRAAPQCGTGETPGSTYPAQTALRNIPGVDPNRIYVAGYSLGGNVALHAAALDDRIAGAAAFAAFTPFRSDSNDRPTLGLRRLYDLHAVIPRLGFFAGDTTAVPYDYDELIGSLAPKPVLIHSPKDDRDATAADVAACADKLAEKWSSAGAASNFTFQAPPGETVMSTIESALLVAWLDNVTSTWQ